MWCVGVEMDLGCVGEDDRDFVGGWDSVGRSWVSLMVSHMLMEEDGWRVT